MTIAIDEKMYYSTKEAAALLNVDYRRLLTWISEGLIPKRIFNIAYVVSGEDFETILRLAHGNSPECIYEGEPETVGYTLKELALQAGVALSTARAIVHEGFVKPVQEIAGKPMFASSDVETLRRATPPSRTRKRVNELTTLPEYKRGVPPLSEREQRILELYDGTGETLEAIGKREWGISRQATNVLYNRARAKQKMLDSGVPPAMPNTTPRKQRLEKADKAILQRALEGKSNAEIAAELQKTGVTEGMVQSRLRKWARNIEKETGTNYERIPLAAYVLTKFGVLQHEQTAA